MEKNLTTSALSPAAMAVLAAYDNAPFTDYDIGDRKAIAVALRAAADQVVIKLAGLGQESAWYLEKIANELEGN